MEYLWQDGVKKSKLCPRPTFNVDIQVKCYDEANYPGLTWISRFICPNQQINMDELFAQMDNLTWMHFLLSMKMYILPSMKSGVLISENWSLKHQQIICFCLETARC